MNAPVTPSVLDHLLSGDLLSLTVGVALLGMSVASWAVILYKAWLLHRASADFVPAKAAFWQAPDLAQAQSRLRSLERVALLGPLVEAQQHILPGTLGAQSDVNAQRTRVLRDALHRVLHRLQSGQVLLATVGATAPFVGLLGTVWGIYHALSGIATAGQLTIEQVAGPVGEALIMTAAGLAVALPAVLAYNVMGRIVHRLEQELEGFARDLLAL
jgi:biopolymer transport protein ExbB